MNCRKAFLACLYESTESYFVTLMLESVWALASHSKVLRQSFFYAVGKALSGELSCMGQGLVYKEIHISKF